MYYVNYNDPFAVARQKAATEIQISNFDFFCCYCSKQKTFWIIKEIHTRAF